MGPIGTTPINNINDNCDTNWLPLGAPNSNNVGAKNGTPPFPAYPSGHATFGAAALHTVRLFYGIPVGHRGGDNLFENLHFVSDEFNGVTTDNKGTIRPKHKRRFNTIDGGLWRMIIENGLSRVYLGVHWSFDAFDTNLLNGQPNLSANIGGVPLGLNIAEDIAQNGLVRSTVNG